MKEKVLVLAGGFDQIAFINKLKKKGKYVILADYFENPPAKNYADEHFQISTLDEEAVYNLAIKENVALVTTACTDQALLTAARVSEKLDLPTYISAKTAMDVTNKAYMKKCFIENNIPTARAVLVEEYPVCKEQIEQCSMFPLIVKPCDCNSSKGVTKVKDKEELFTAVEKAFDMSRSNKVIIEEYIEGREISIDVWVEKESAKILAVSETKKIPNVDDSFTIFQSQYPTKGIERYKEQIEDIADNIARAFHLSDCPMLIQALIKEDQIFVIEFSARMGGGTKYKLIEYISGIDIMEVYTNRILGIKEQNIQPKWSEKIVELDYLYTENGTVTEIRGLDKCIEMGVISDYFQYKSLGSKITMRKTSSDRTAGILLVADSEEKMGIFRKSALDNIQILDGEKDILYRECFN